MLCRLTVENYILIDRLEIEFGRSLNIITGETGAGKSILLGALGLLLGNRADVNVIRDPERKCVIEGVFDIAGYDLEWFFSEHDLDYDPQTVIRRVISSPGKSRAYINDLPVQQTMLKEFAGYLIDIHSQNENSVMSSNKFRCGLLDKMAGQEDLYNNYLEKYFTVKSLQRELQTLTESSHKNRQDEEWLRFQVDELQAAKLIAEEQRELEQSLNELSHASLIKDTLNVCTSSLSADEDGVIVRLKTLENSLKSLREYYLKAEEFAQRIRSVITDLKDIDSELALEEDRVEADPSSLEAARHRLDMIYSLEQKHKVSSVAQLIEIREKYSERLHAIENYDNAIAELEERLSHQMSEANQWAALLHEGRQKVVVSVEEYVNSVMAELGMKDASFKVVLQPEEKLGPLGTDNILFMFASAKDMPFSPIEKVASGGEMSRLMLSLKSLAAQTRNLPTIIFDEIDTGVSGRIADAMGNIINDISAGLQVINITHLPQVASKGDTHFVVSKCSDDSGTHTTITPITGEDRVNEIAKMLSGDQITEAAITQAQFLLQKKA